MALRTLYEILDVSSNASSEAIKISYERLVAKFDPDSKENATIPNARIQHDAVKEAFLTLNNPAKRTQYDKKLIERSQPAFGRVEVIEPFWTLPKLIVVALIVIVGGGYYYKHKQEETRLAAEKAIVAAKAREAEELAKVEVEKARRDIERRRQELPADERQLRERDLSHATAASLLTATAPHADSSGRARIEAIDVEEAAARIQQHSSRPSVVLLYATTCPLSQRLFPAFVTLAREYKGRPVDFLVFSTDEESDAKNVTPFLERHGAPFPPIFIRPWPSGNLDRSLTPFGIKVGKTWTRPLVAVRDRGGRVIAQAQAITDIAPIRAALERVAQ